jgi:5-hydroxyisourate hydrolase-like protein (transthyretin family)
MLKRLFFVLLVVFCTPAFSAVNTIKGRIVDSLSKKPITILIKLYKCGDDGSCSQYMKSLNTNAKGEYIISQDYEGSPLESGNYKVSTSGNNKYQKAESTSFVANDEKNVLVGDLAVAPRPAQVSVKGCTLPIKGGICKFSVTVTNGQAKALVAKVWNIVEINWKKSYESGPDTVFQLPAVTTINLLKTGTSKTLNFQFTVPTRLINTPFLITSFVGDTSKDFGFNIKGSGVGLVTKAK